MIVAVQRPVADCLTNAWTHVFLRVHVNRKVLDRAGYPPESRVCGGIAVNSRAARGVALSKIGDESELHLRYGPEH